MPLTNQAKYVFGQSARGLVGDPTQANGAGLIDLSTLNRAEIVPQFGRQIISNEGNQMLKDGATGWTKGAQVTLTLFSAQADILGALIPEVTANGDALEFRNSVATLVTPSLIIVPETEIGQADTSELVWFFPSVVMVEDPGAFIFKLEESLESGEPFDVTLAALVTIEDQAQAALNDGQQILFRGNMPAGWSFPEPYVPGV